MVVELSLGSFRWNSEPEFHIIDFHSIISPDPDNFGWI